MIRTSGLLLALTLAACNGTPEAPAPETNEASTPAPAPNASPTPVVEAATPIPTGTRSCETELGVRAAQALADQCRAVSPATRPPCNVANSCAMIREEIARSCDLFADDPPAECEKLTDDKKAAAVVGRYYDAIDARDYSTAYALWDGNGEASGKSAKAFADGFATTRSSNVKVTGDVTVEGGAGSLYAEVPVRVEAVLADGGQQRFTGVYVLRRVNNVDGSTAEQRRWHIASAKLKAA